MRTRDGKSNQIRTMVEAATGEIPKDGKSFLTDPAYTERISENLGLKMQALKEHLTPESKKNGKRAKSKMPSLDFVVEIIPENVLLSISNNKLMLQVIFFAIFFGLTLATLPREITGNLIKTIEGLNEVFLKMVDITMKAAPFFVFALLAGVVAKMADTPAEVFEIFKSLSWYSLTVVIGLGLMIFVIYPLMVKLFVRVISYSKFFKNIAPAQFLAFSTSSSAATLPVTMECLEENMKVSKKVASFVLPIGATVNMDGTSLYQAVAVVFLAQLHMIDLTLAQQLTIVATATLSSIGAAAARVPVLL